MWSVSARSEHQPSHLTARAAKPARNSSDRASGEERRREKERAEPPARGAHPSPAATAPVTCRTPWVWINLTTEPHRCTRGGEGEEGAENQPPRPGREQVTEGEQEDGRRGLSEVQAAENVARRVSPREPEEERMVGDTRRKAGAPGARHHLFLLYIDKYLF